MPVTHSEFVADVTVIFQAGTGSGSGRLIAPGLVLTARHVISPSRGPAWSVLLLGEQKPGNPWEKPRLAEVAWQGKGDVDLALLRLLPDADPRPTPRLQPHFSSYDRAVSLGDVSATGFPEAWRTQTRTRDFTVPGSLWISTRDGSYGWLVAARPDDRTGWQGMSGAVVCHLVDDTLHLFGVVEQVPANFSHGQLEVARLSKAFEDADFCHLLQTAMGALPQIKPFDPEEKKASQGPRGGSRVPSRFPALTDGVEGNGLSSLEDFLSEYLLRPNAPLKFLGRAGEKTSLDAWLRNPNAPPYFALLGNTGRGKSALAAEWAQELATSGDVSVVLVPVAIRFGLTRGEDLVRVWLQRLQRIGNESTVISPNPATWVDAIHQYLRTDRPAPQPQLLVIIDGLDEAADAGWFRFPQRVGAGLKILLVSRILAGEIKPEDSLERMGLNRATPRLVLSPLSEDDLAEVEDVLERKIPGAAARLWRLTQGDPLLVRLYLEWFSEYAARGEPLPDVDPDSNESGLARYIRMWWEQVESTAGLAITGKVRDFLELLACAYGPLIMEDIATMADIDPFSIAAARGPLRRILIGDGKAMAFAFSHPRIGQFFAEELMTKMHRAEKERRLLDYCRETSLRIGNGEIPASDASRYVLTSTIDHFRKSSAPMQDYLGLLGQGWMLIRRNLDGYYAGYLADLKRIREDARQTLEIRAEVRCALAIATIVSLSDSVPAPLLKLAVDEKLITGSQAVEMVREMVEPRSRAVSIASLAPSLSQADASKALGVANLIPDQETRLIAFAGLVSYLSPAEQEALADQLNELDDREDLPPMVVFLASSTLEKIGDWANWGLNVISESDLAAPLSGQIYGDINGYIEFVGQVVPVLHPRDQRWFTDVVARATSERAYKWLEADYAERLITAVAEFASFEAIATLQELVAKSSEKSQEANLRLLARLAILGDVEPFMKALEQWDSGTPRAAAAGLAVMDEPARQRWVRHA